MSIYGHWSWSHSWTHLSTCFRGNLLGLQLGVRDIRCSGGSSVTQRVCKRLSNVGTGGVDGTGIGLGHAMQMNSVRLSTHEWLILSRRRGSTPPSTVSSLSRRASHTVLICILVHLHWPGPSHHSHVHVAANGLFNSLLSTLLST